VPADGAKASSHDGQAETPTATQAGNETIRGDRTAPGKPAAAPGTGWRTWRAQAAALARRHWLISALLAAGLVLRVLAQIAYQPALFYVDTLKYLYGAWPGTDPLGYTVVLKSFLLFGDLGTVTAAQHLLGLAMAVALYAVLLRRGCSRWLAALACAPVLLDAYQLQMEQTIMPDVWFEALIVAGLAVLLWRPAVTVPFAVAAGLILGASATMRATGEILVLPAVAGLVAFGGQWRQIVVRSAALAAAFALPILGYCGVSYAKYGHFWLAESQTTIGRVAAAADCATLRLPADVRPLCPPPAEQAKGPDWLEHSSHSALYAARIPRGANRRVLLEELSSAVKHQQPLRIVAAIARDSVRLFALTRDPVESVTPLSRWQFQAGFPTFPPNINLGRGDTIVLGIQHKAFGRIRDVTLDPSYGGRARVDHPLAAFLRGYQVHGGYTPGPLLALFTLAGVAGSVLALVRRQARRHRTLQLAMGALLFTLTAVAVLLMPDVLEFSWRYQLPAVVILPPAGVLGIGALLRLRRPRPAATAAQPEG
jgi:hypothetical protein